LRENIEFVEEQ